MTAPDRALQDVIIPGYMGAVNIAFVSHNNPLPKQQPLRCAVALRGADGINKAAGSLLLNRQTPIASSGSS